MPADTTKVLAERDRFATFLHARLTKHGLHEEARAAADLKLLSETQLAYVLHTEVRAKMKADQETRDAVRDYLRREHAPLLAVEKDERVIAAVETYLVYFVRELAA